MLAEPLVNMLIKSYFNHSLSNFYSMFELSRQNQLSSCEGERSMEGKILNTLKHVKNISKKQATVTRIYSVMKKTHKNLTKNELENVIESMVDKTIVEFNQRLISLTTLPWLNKCKALMKKLHRHPPKTIKILLKRRGLGWTLWSYW